MNRNQRAWMGVVILVAVMGLIASTVATRTFADALVIPCLILGGVGLTLVFRDIGR